MSDHVHPIVRRMARRVDADEVRCVNEARGQHKIIFRDADGMDAMFSAFDRKGVDGHGFRIDGFLVIVTVFVKEAQTVTAFERHRSTDDGLKDTGITAYNWYGVDRRRKPATA